MRREDIHIESWDDYQRLALITAGNRSLPCAALGLCGEVGELLLVSVEDAVEGERELGDVAWYMALMATALGASMTSWMDNPSLEGRFTIPGCQNMVHNTLAVADIVKKLTFHGHPMTRHALELSSRLNLITEGWFDACASWDVGPVEVLKTNVLKLAERYPDGFSEAASVNRKV